MKIVLEKAVIRDWKKHDADSIVRHANDRAVWRNLMDRFPHPYTRADAQDWLRFAGEQKPPTNFAIEVEGYAAGGIGFRVGEDVHRRSAEIGYWLGKAYWGRGIVTAALKSLTDYAFQHADLCRIQACVFAWNPASARVLEKAGYTFEGRMAKSVTKDGETTDQLIYAIVR